jgi:hypothetical protein
MRRSNTPPIAGASRRTDPCPSYLWRGCGEIPTAKRRIPLHGRFGTIGSASLAASDAPNGQVKPGESHFRRSPVARLGRSPRPSARSFLVGALVEPPMALLYSEFCNLSQGTAQRGRRPPSAMRWALRSVTWEVRRREKAAGRSGARSAAIVPRFGIGSRPDRDANGRGCAQSRDCWLRLDRNHRTPSVG